MKSVVTSLLVAATGALLSIGSSAGCLSRPTAKEQPSTKETITTTVSQQAIDKVDLLFAIDNSQSMGDKQTILKDAVPRLIQGLLTPACVNKTTRVKTGQRASYKGSKNDNYGCDAGSEPEFKPVTDMHIGIISSSLGDFGRDDRDRVCTSARANDRGHLLAKKPGGQDDTRDAPDDFLAWFPDAADNDDAKRHPKPAAPIGVDIDPGGDRVALVPTFQELVVGVDQNGCGLESQLESVYRFLIQPDPWDQVLELDAEGKADIGLGIDTDVLKQRADFLRPDSLVSVIMLTDEDDSSSDPLAVNGFGYAFMAKNFPHSKVQRPEGGTTAPRGTSACETDPASPDCTSCGFAIGCDPNDARCQRIKQDPSCAKSPIAGKSGPGFDGFYGPGDDSINVRFHRMKQRYGVDPQYPIQRYVDGFTKPRVPDRTAEHKVVIDRAGKRQISDYVVGAGNCTNPLFAQRLPREGSDYCDLPRGGRTADKVFFALVGGVPNQLLHYDPAGTEEAADHNRITSADWQKILGSDPKHFRLDGIDPHMIQSVGPRRELLGAGDPESPRGDNGSDPIHGREYDTHKNDLQYACTFDLPTANDCKSGSCDCGLDPTTGEPATNAPLCAAAGTTQIKAKAYPTIRQLEVVHDLGDQGIVASLCPIQLENKEAADYGYNPAVAAIIERLRNALTATCLPHPLKPADDSSNVPCLILAQLSLESGQTCDQLGLARPDAQILEVYRQQLKAESGNVGDAGISTAEICQLDQKPVAKGETCVDDAELEWCYVENDGPNKKTPANRCAQAILFSAGTAQLVNARFSLQCLEQLKANPDN